MSSAFTEVVNTITAIPSSTAAATNVTSTPEVSPTIDRPSFETEEIPGKLDDALQIETLPDFDGHSLWRINGWHHGFNGVNWAGAHHLVLYPYAGTVPFLDGSMVGTYPTVVNIDSQTFWIPDERLSLSWSEQLGVFIVPVPNNSVVIYSPDGNVMDTYPGTLYGVSPSATKILIDDTWIDLSSRKTVDFGWVQTGYAADYAGAHQFPPIWSPDEMRVYACCYAYGDARTGASLIMPYDDLTLDGKKEGFSMLAFGGTWVLNDQYMLPIGGGAWDDRLMSVYVFDPAAKTYRNLSKIVGVPFGGPGNGEPYCDRLDAPNGGRYVWVTCTDGGYVIDLVTLDSTMFPPSEDVASEWSSSALPEIEWSADGTFARLTDDPMEWILDAAGREIKIPPAGRYKNWHPTENKLIYLSDDGKVLSILDVTSMEVREVPLPMSFRVRVWSPDGTRIALRAEDGSVWQMSYPSLDDLEQLTEAIPSQPVPPSYGNSPVGKWFAWSPDSTAIAFLNGADIYIVATGNNPEK